VDNPSEKFALIYEFNNDSPLFARVANQYINSKKYQQAVTILERGIFDYSEYATAYFLYAVALAHCGDKAQAVEMVRKASELLGTNESLKYYTDMIENIVPEPSEDEIHLYSGEYFENKIDGRTYIISQESSPLGTAGAIKYAESKISSDVFLAMNGDSFCPVNLNSLLNFHSTNNALASVALAPMEDAGDYGGVALKKNGEITSFEEKINSPTSGWVNAGIYMFDKAIMDLIPTAKNVSLEREIFPTLVGKGLYGFTSHSRLLDIGTPERLERARQLLTKMN